MTNLPDKYTPSALRLKVKPKPKKVKYGVGIIYEPGIEIEDLALHFGPYESIFDALEVVGEENVCEGVFELPSGIELYHWDQKNLRWVKNDPIDPKR
jgi:hypothetical protein